MIEFLQEVGNNHIYSVRKFSGRYSEWPVIREELIRHDCLNEKDGSFGIDASMPVRYLRALYQDRMDGLRRQSAERKRERFHRYWQDACIALSVILSAIALILSLK